MNSHIFNGWTINNIKYTYEIQMNPEKDQKIVGKKLGNHGGPIRPL